MTVMPISVQSLRCWPTNYVLENFWVASSQLSHRMYPPTLESNMVPVPDTDFGRLIDDKKDPFFWTKSRSSTKPKWLFDTLPLSILDFDFDLKDKSPYNGYNFEESNSEAVFSDNVLGQNPMEALVQIREQLSLEVCFVIYSAASIPNTL